MNSTPPATEIYSPGLEGVIAGETAISTVTGGLRYRGYPIAELAASTTFEEVAYLLLHGELPTASEVQQFSQRIRHAQNLPPTLIQVLRQLPPTTLPMDALRTAASILAHFDPETTASSPEANRRKAERLLGQLPVVVATHFRLSVGKEPIEPRSDLSLASNFLHMLRGTVASPAEVRAMDISLILYAEHEFNASTFTSRVIVSTLSDLHSGIVGGIGALKGALHGGANERVMEVLERIGDVSRAEAWLAESFVRKERVMGFGHRVYKTGDVRAVYLKTIAADLAKTVHQEHWEALADKIEQILDREKGLMPNLDWPSARVYHYLGLAVPRYTPIFVMSRVAGWSAHIIEQLGANRLIRPRARYTGPDVRAVTPLAQRG